MFKAIKEFIFGKPAPVAKVEDKVEAVNAAPYKIEAPVEVPTLTAVVEGAGVVEAPAKKAAPKAKAPAKKTEVKKAPVKKAPVKKPTATKAKAKPAAAKPAKKSAK